MQPPRRSGRARVERKLYSPSPFNAGASFTESNMRSPGQPNTTPAKQVVGGFGQTTPVRQNELVSLSGQRHVVMVQETVQAQSPDAFFAQPEEEHVSSTALGQQGVSAEQIFNAWFFADKGSQSEVFMAIGLQVFRHENEEQAADRLLTFMLTCKEPTRFYLFNYMYEQAKLAGQLPQDRADIPPDTSGTVPVGGPGGLDGDTAKLISQTLAKGPKGGSASDGPLAKRQKGGADDRSDEEEGYGSMKFKIRAVKQVLMTTSKVLHERTAETQVECWYFVKNHAYRAVCVAYFGECGTKPGFRHASIVDAILRPSHAFRTRPDLKEASEYYVIVDPSTFAKLVAAAERADFATGHLGILPEEVDITFFRGFCLFAAYDALNACQDACYTVGGLFNTLVAGGHHPSQFEANSKIRPEDARTPYYARHGHDRWSGYDGFNRDTLGHPMEEHLTGSHSTPATSTGGGGTGGGALSGGGRGGGGGGGGHTTKPSRRPVQGLSQQEVDTIPLCFFSRLSTAEIQAYHAAKVAGLCLNCYGAGHMGRDCPQPCAWPMCRGKPTHIAKDCKMVKSKNAH